MEPDRRPHLRVCLPRRQLRDGTHAQRGARRRRQEIGGFMRRLLLALAIAVSLFASLMSGTARAQQASGIAGTVRDSSGGVLPGVAVEAASPALIERVRVALSDGEGRYNIVKIGRASCRERADGQVVDGG